MSTINLENNTSLIDIIEYVGLTEDHLALLHKNRVRFEECAHQIVEQFYKKIVKNTHLSNIVMEYSSFERLIKSQTMYFKHLFSEKIDELYILFVQKIGYAHHRIGLSAEWYLAGVDIYLDCVYQICKDLENGIAIYHAFSKRILFDTKVCLIQYDRLKQEAETK